MDFVGKSALPKIRINGIRSNVHGLIQYFIG